MATEETKKSFKLLTSGDFDIIIEKEGTKMNVSELLRDLYSKMFALSKVVMKLNDSLNIQQPVEQEGGGPPDSSDCVNEPVME